MRAFTCTKFQKFVSPFQVFAEGRANRVQTGKTRENTVHQHVKAHFSLKYSMLPKTPVTYSTTPRNENPVHENHLDQSLRFSQKNENSLTWVLVALTVCFTYPVLYRVSSESRAGECEL